MVAEAEIGSNVEAGVDTIGAPTAATTGWGGGAWPGVAVAVAIGAPPGTGQPTPTMDSTPAPTIGGVTGAPPTAEASVESMVGVAWPAPAAPMAATGAAIGAAGASCGLA